MLELKNICVSFRSERQDKIFGHTRQQVLFDISLSVKKGTCLGILGESGSGKSTMGRVLCGLLRPDSGEALLDGVSVYGSRAGRRNLQNKLSVVFQDYTTSANPRFRVKEIIGEGLTVRERRGKRRLDRARETARLLELVGLGKKADSYPTELSGGEQQMLAMGRALMSQPKIILMDEPSMGLSPIFVNEIFDIIKEVSESGTTVLLVEQNAKKALSIADRAYVLETGRITLEGKASDLLHDESVQKAYLGE